MFIEFSGYIVNTNHIVIIQKKSTNVNIILSLSIGLDLYESFDSDQERDKRFYELRVLI